MGRLRERGSRKDPDEETFPQGSSLGPKFRGITENRAISRLAFETGVEAILERMDIALMFARPS